MKVLFTTLTNKIIEVEPMRAVAAFPLNAFSISISDTCAVVDVRGDQWLVPIGDLVHFIKSHGVKHAPS